MRKVQRLHGTQRMPKLPGIQRMQVLQTIHKMQRKVKDKENAKKQRKQRMPEL